MIPRATSFWRECSRSRGTRGTLLSGQSGHRGPEPPPKGRRFGMWPGPEIPVSENAVYQDLSDPNCVTAVLGVLRFQVKT